MQMTGINFQTRLGHHIDKILTECYPYTCKTYKYNFTLQVISMNYKKELHDLFLMQQTYATMFSLTNKLQIAGDNSLNGMTIRQYMTVVAILHLAEDETTINNIARKLGTSKQNANRMVSGIERLGYISSFQSEKDKRAANIRLTEIGKKKMVECSEEITNFMADVFHSFGTSELETLWRLLKKLHCFDGHKQDGFEEAGLEFKDISEAAENALLEAFSKKRNSK